MKRKTKHRLGSDEILLAVDDLGLRRSSIFALFKGRVLDLGCGAAEYTIPLALEARCEVFCVDNDLGALKEARNFAKRLSVWEQIHIIRSDGNVLSFRPDSFDILVFKSALHHLRCWRLVVKSASDWLGSNGILYLEEPLRTNPIARIGVILYWSLLKWILRTHRRPAKEQWPFLPWELLPELESNFAVKRLSYHQFNGRLVQKLASYSKGPELRNVLTLALGVLARIEVNMRRRNCYNLFAGMIVIVAANSQRQAARMKAIPVF